MEKVQKTTFDEEQRRKEDAFLALMGEERLALMLKARTAMYKPGVDYTYAGRKVTITRRNEPL